MPNKSTVAQVPDSSTVEKTEELIRLRAYQHYQARGCDDGHDVEDWLRAEAEIQGKKPAESAAKSRLAVAGAA